MAWDDDDDDFDMNDFEFDPDDEELQKEMDAENERITNLTIVKKADELYHLVNSLVETIDGKDANEDVPSEMLEHYKSMMLEDVMIIGAKIQGAEGGDLYTLRMENAVIIKVHARSLLTHTSGLKMLGYPNHEYLQILRDEIDEFRKLFIEWVNSFDKSNDIEDEWGNLFK
jgi:hypothetical protein